MAEDPDALLINPYRAAITRHRATAAPHVASLRTRLDEVESAMAAGAWVSTSATTFEADLAGHRAQLQTAADESLQTFDDALTDQPSHVAPDDWQAGWHRIR